MLVYVSCTTVPVRLVTVKRLFASWSHNRFWFMIWRAIWKHWSKPGLVSHFQCNKLYESLLLCDAVDQLLSKIQRQREKQTDKCWNHVIKGQFRYLTHWGPFLGCLGWTRVVDTERWLLVLSLVFSSFRTVHACFRLAGYGHSQPVLKTTLNVRSPIGELHDNKHH